MRLPSYHQPHPRVGRGQQKSHARLLTGVSKAIGIAGAFATPLWAVGCAPPVAPPNGLRFASCDADALTRDAAQIGLRLALAPCGRNQLRGPQWTQDGQLLLFGVGDARYVLDGNQHLLQGLPAVSGNGPCVWLGRRVACAQENSLTIASTQTSSSHPLAFAPEGLLAAPDDTIWYWRGSDVRRYDPQVGASFPALGWQPAGRPYPNFAAGLVTVQDGDDVSTRALADGGEVQRIGHARRGRVSNDGRWTIAITDGPSVSVFDEQPWDGVEPLVGLPDERVTIPMIVVAHADGRRWRVTSFQATEADWYAAPGWISVHLWGLYGRHVRANVALYDLAPRLATLEGGDQIDGFEPMAADNR
jgi:hypothetical protein